MEEEGGGVEEHMEEGGGVEEHVHRVLDRICSIL